MTEIFECDFCGEEVFNGDEILIDKGGELHSCGYTGEYEEGAGECEECGKLYCMDCGADGLCHECRELQEVEE